METRWAQGLGVFACATALGCAPGAVGDGALNEDDVALREPDVASGVDRPATRDAAAPMDVVAPTFDAPAMDRSLPNDLVTAVDRVSPPDVPAVVDAPAPIDLGPPDTGCPLPPPAARPPAAGPDGSALVRALAAEHPDWLRDSCVAMGGSHRFLFEALRRGRALDPRWGLDRRTGTLSGDIVTYFYGDGCPEGRREVYMFDIITRLCARPGIDEPAAARRALPRAG